MPHLGQTVVERAEMTHQTAGCLTGNCASQNSIVLTVTALWILVNMKKWRRKREQIVSQMLSWWRGWNPRSNCSILMLVLSAAIAVNFQITVRYFGLGKGERQFVSHFTMIAYKCCIFYDKLWMPETEISICIPDVLMPYLQCSFYASKKHI